MARGYVTVKPGTPGRTFGLGSLWYPGGTVFVCGEPRLISARVESQGVVVWRDDGYPNITVATEMARTYARAFDITSHLGQHHIPWSQVVDESMVL